MIKIKNLISFPKINTNRLFLRNLQNEDAPILHQYWSDPQVTQYMSKAFTTMQETIDMIELLKILPNMNEGYRWAIILRKNKQLIGTCGFHNFNPEHFRVEIGYELNQNYWGMGIIHEALTAIINYGFYTQNYNRIEAFVTYGNNRSIATLQKLGFQQDGLLRNYEFINNSFVDQYCFSLLKNDWQNLIKELKIDLP